MSARLIEIIIMEGIALLMLLLWYAIGIRQKIELIAGVNKHTRRYLTDKAGLARLVGRVCLLVALASALMPLATGLWGETRTGWYFVVGHYGGFIIGLVALTLLQARDYIQRLTE